jgi:hypothetical protein
MDEYLKLLASLPQGSGSIALGDLYLGRPDVSLPEMESQHRFITGVHDKSISIREERVFGTRCVTSTTQPVGPFPR